MDCVALLQLLLDEASPGRFEEPLEGARAAGASDDEIDRLRHATVLALQLRAVLRERRRREIELAALYETAGDLIAIRDVERVLRAIVRRARQLLDADTAYLTLIDDERGDTYMRVTDGMVTPEFGRIRLPLGVGLGGLVAETSTPYFTSNYLDDPRFLHTGDIDDVVAGEGLTAILGVPLKVGDRVIGVLFAANRQQRPFAPDEVNLLASLGAHAAIAIDNARLFQEARQAVHELNAAGARIRARSEAVERAAEVHERLTQIVVEGGTVDDVAEAVAYVLGGAVDVVDAEGRWLSHRTTDDAEPEPWLADALAAARASGRTITTDADGGATWLTPIVTGEGPVAVLVLRGRRGLEEGDVRTLERAAQVLALLLMNQRATAEAERRVRGELLDDLLTPPQRDLPALVRRARLLGVDLTTDHSVAVASTEAAARTTLLQAAIHVTRRTGGLASERHGTVVVVTDRDPADEVLDAIAKQVRQPITWGVAGPATGPEAVLAAYEDAERCRRTLVALGRVGDRAHVDALGVYALLFNTAGRHELERYVDRTIGPLRTYDADRGTDLLRTLEAYFEAGNNATQAAARLHVHVNTLYQRLERIGAIVGDGWQRADRLLELHLAITLRRLSEDHRVWELTTSSA